MQFKSVAFLGLGLLGVPELSMPQTPPQSETLAISGYPGTAPTTRVNGKSYVSVEALARLTGGSLTFQPNRVTLALAGNPPDNAPKKETGYSREFMTAVIEQMAVIREWRVAVGNAVQHNYPVAEEWIGNYRRSAASRLALVSAAATTDSDRSAQALVSNEFGSMQQLTNRFIALHQSLTYVSPDSLDGDPLDQKILDCARSLESLSTGSQFQDIPTCH